MTWFQCNCITCCFDWPIFIKILYWVVFSWVFVWIDDLELFPTIIIGDYDFLHISSDDVRDRSTEFQKINHSLPSNVFGTLKKVEYAGKNHLSIYLTSIHLKSFHDQTSRPFKNTKSVIFWQSGFTYKFYGLQITQISLGQKRFIIWNSIRRSVKCYIIEHF